MCVMVMGVRDECLSSVALPSNIHNYMLVITEDSIIYEDYSDDERTVIQLQILYIRNELATCTTTRHACACAHA